MDANYNSQLTMSWFKDNNFFVVDPNIQTLRFGWLWVLILYKEDYFQKIYMCVLLITRLLRLVGRLSARKPVGLTTPVCLLLLL